MISRTPCLLIALSIAALGVACGGASAQTASSSTLAPSVAVAGPRLAPAAHPPEVGAEVPAFVLQNAGGAPLDSHEALSHGPLVLVFYRGHWCEQCRTQLTQLQAGLPGFQRRNATLWAISTDTPAQAREVVAQLGLAFPIGTDTDLNVIRGFGLQVPGGEMATPATYILAPGGAGGRVAYRFISETNTDRPATSTIIEALNEVHGAASGPPSGGTN